MAQILLIDDDALLRDTVRQLLELDGHQVEEACDGAVGLSKLRQRTAVDLVITDMLMPQMDGYSFVQEIKRHDVLRNIPILVVTAKDEMQELFVAEGVSCFLVKPIKTEVFLEKVRQLTGM